MQKEHSDSRITRVNPGLKPVFFFLATVSTWKTNHTILYKLVQKQDEEELHKYPYIASITLMRIQRQMQLAAKLGIYWLQKKGTAEKNTFLKALEDCGSEMVWHTKVHLLKVASFRFISPPKAKPNAIIVLTMVFQLVLWKICLGSWCHTVRGKDAGLLERPHSKV